MNANTLADELDDIDAYEKHQTLLGKASEMLRQQQAEIKDLKQQVAFLEDWRDIWSPTIKQLMNINVKVNEE